MSLKYEQNQTEINQSEELISVQGDPVESNDVNKV